jgi:uncharacterized membrane protein
MFHPTKGTIMSPVIFWVAVAVVAVVVIATVIVKRRKN